MPIERISGASPVASGARPRRRQTDFAVPETGETADTHAPAEASAAAQVPLLTLQAGEMAEAEAATDRAAAGHGNALLGAMRGLQLALLGGSTGQGPDALAQLADTLPQAADPALDAVLRAIAQRAAIERARRIVRTD
jgi:hypothetical protein